MTKINTAFATALAGAVLIVAQPALAAQCNHNGGFNGFIAEFKKEAASKGISNRGLAALDGITIDDKVLAADRRQGVFKQTFEQFSGRMISQDRLVKGARHMQQLAGSGFQIRVAHGSVGSAEVYRLRLNLFDPFPGKGRIRAR